MIKHEQIEKSVGLLIVLTLLTVIWGGLLEIVPLFFQKSTTTPVEGTKPYDAVRLAGRDIYIREGCFLCHSQMIRPFRAETERYGHYSVAGEYVYDHPFQWGSKRTGPDLAFLANTKAKDSVGADIEKKMEVMRGYAKARGIPTYSDEEIKGAKAAIGDKTELDVLIAYLQGMGTALSTMKQ